MVLERWDRTAKVTYDRRVMNELSSLRFVEDHRNVVILGPIGAGKTFLANALGHLCCRAGFNARLQRADALLGLLKLAWMDRAAPGSRPAAPGAPRRTSVRRPASGPC